MADIGVENEDEEVLRMKECIGLSPYGPVYRGEVDGSSVNILTLQRLLQDVRVSPLSGEGRRFSEHLSESYFDRSDLPIDSSLVIFPMGIQWPDDGKEEDVAAVVTESFLAGEKLYGRSGREDRPSALVEAGGGERSADSEHKTQCNGVAPTAESIWSEELDECDLVDIACDLAAAVCSLHSLGQIHGNICPGLLAVRRGNKHTKVRKFSS